VLEHQRRPDRRARHRGAVQQGCTVDVGLEQRERRVDLAGRIRGDPPGDRRRERRRDVGVLLGQDDREARGQPLEELEHVGSRWQSTGQDHARRGRLPAGEVGGDHAEEDVGAVPRGDDDDLVVEPVEHVRQRHGRHQDAARLAAEYRGVTGEEVGLAGIRDLRHRRGGEHRRLRQRVHRHVPVGHAGRDRRELARVDAVGDDGDDLASRGPHRGHADVGGGPDLGRRPVVAGDDAHHRQAEVRRDACVERELAGGARLGEVASHDEDAVAARSQRPEPLDDLRHRLVLVGEDVGVRDPEARLVRLRLRQRGRRRSMDGSEPSTAETTGRKTPSRSTRRASRSNSPSETAALPVPGSQPSHTVRRTSAPPIASCRSAEPR
jgi:hypothetical protein